MALLSELHEDGQTIVFVTHDKSRARVADRVIEMIDGRIVSDKR